MTEKTEAIKSLAEREEADIYLYSALIFPKNVDKFRTIVFARNKRREKAILFLTTSGGDPDAAFRLMKSLRKNYGNIATYIFGPCKSAGTLAVTGADRIVLGEFGELGPLDVQLTKPDEIYPTSSGLDIFQAVGVLTNSAFEAFQKYLIEIIANSEGHISAKTSAEIARELAVGLFAPMTAQIEPERLGEVQRAINIATEYGKRLDKGNVEKGALERLVQGYPTHGFVIDADEAKTLFKNVKEADALERQVASFFPLIRQPSEPCLADLISLVEDAQDATKTEPKRASRDIASGSPTTIRNVTKLKPDAGSDAPSAEENIDAGDFASGEEEKAGGN